MSWFSTDALKANLSGGSDMLKGWVTDKVISKETLEKLTLSTPELKEERERMDQEEKRKEQVKDMMAGMYPWETRDPERDILVEECKEAIMKLPSDKASFFGPYAMPRPSVKVIEHEKEKGSNEIREGNEEVIAEEAIGSKAAREPSQEQLERLKILEPLPPLLQDFEIETHVGLIQKMLKVDSVLAQMHAKYGVGEFERTFWRNYFFNCAYCRYEAGLSIDEIWSENQSVPCEPTTEPHEEETIVFDHPGVAEKRPESTKAFPAEPTTEVNGPFGDEAIAAVSEKDSSSPAVSTTEFEMVGDNIDQELSAALDDIDAGAEYELDELEAEIARELED